MAWKKSTYKDIDWQIRHLISTHTSSTRRPWNIKFSCNRLPLYGESHFVTESEMCPVCKKGRETSDHFLECKMYGVTTQECQAQVTKTCQKHKVDPYLRYLIQLIVRGEPCTVEHIEADNPLFPLEDYKLVLEQQEAIGWHNFKRGYVSLEWDQHQQRYLGQTKQVTRNTVIWMANIILDIQ